MTLTRDIVPGGPPVVAIVGRSGSGKTTLLEGVIAALTAHGLRVAVVKHHGHDTELDVPRKDSWRHARAGAATTIVSGPAQLAMVRRVSRERTLAELVALAGDADVVLTEGFRAEAGACVEVLRAANSAEPLCDASELVALVTDLEPAALPPRLAEAVRGGRVRVFGLGDAEALAAAIAGELAEAVPR